MNGNPLFNLFIFLKEERDVNSILNLLKDIKESFLLSQKSTRLYLSKVIGSYAKDNCLNKKIYDYRVDDEIINEYFISFLIDLKTNPSYIYLIKVVDNVEEVLSKMDTEDNVDSLIDSLYIDKIINLDYISKYFVNTSFFILPYSYEDKNIKYLIFGKNILIFNNLTKTDFIDLISEYILNEFKKRLDDYPFMLKNMKLSLENENINLSYIELFSEIIKVYLNDTKIDLITNKITSSQAIEMLSYI